MRIHKSVKHKMSNIIDKMRSVPRTRSTFRLSLIIFISVEHVLRPGCSLSVEHFLRPGCNIIELNSWHFLLLEGRVEWPLFLDRTILLLNFVWQKCLFFLYFSIDMKCMWVGEGGCTTMLFYAPLPPSLRKLTVSSYSSEKLTVPLPPLEN